MLPERILKQMVRKIHSFPDLEGCLIGLHGNRQSRVLHHGYSMTPNSERVIIIIEECEADTAVSSELHQWAKVPGGSPDGAPNPSAVMNRSRLGPELIGAGLSCGLTVVSAVGVFSGAAAEVPTGGASTFLVVASWTGLVTQGIQCANGLVRITAIAISPDGDTLQQWDNNNAYSASILVVDAVGVVSTVSTLPFAVRNLWAVLARQRSFIARRLTFESLKNMNRAGRLRTIGEVMEEASRTPEGRAALIAAAREAGVGAKSIQSTSGLSVRHANTLVRIISEETTRRLSDSLRDILISGVGSIVASATPASATGSASGSVNWIIHLIDGGAPATRI